MYFSAIFVVIQHLPALDCDRGMRNPELIILPGFPLEFIPYSDTGRE
jgi:hypothetical protein